MRVQYIWSKSQKAVTSVFFLRIFCIQIGLTFKNTYIYGKF